MIAKSFAGVAAAMVCASGVHAGTIKLTEGTELSLRFDEKVSSATNTEGDRFSISMDDDLTLSDGAVIKAGHRGVGEVTAVRKKGMMGKAGELNVRYEYIKIGDTRVRLRGSRGAEGKGAVGSTVALTVLFGPIGLIKKGKDVEIKPGQHFRAYVDQDVNVIVPDMPIAVSVAAPAAAEPVSESAPPVTAPVATPAVLVVAQ